MTKAEFQRVFNLADSRGPTGCKSEDMAVLDGCGLPGFERVHTTVNVVAYWLRWQALRFDGTWDPEELNECAQIARQRIILVNMHSQYKGIRCPGCSSEKFAHNPLDDTKYICRECGHWFNA